jgi:DNA-directed RNA polymerase subunit RPC12/RpoP
MKCDECGETFEPMTDAYKCPTCGTENYPDEDDDMPSRKRPIGECEECNFPLYAGDDPYLCEACLLAQSQGA